MARQKRSDSATAAVQAAQNAAQGPRKPPAHLTIPDAVLPFWEAVMRSRPRHRWTDSDLATAAILARAQYDIERHTACLIEEGDFPDGKANPRLLEVDKLARRVASLSRLLHVHPEATEGRAREAGNTLELEREAATEVDPLIPTLRAVQ